MLILSYRDYPQIIRAGLAREQAWAAAQQAMARGDAAAIEQAYRAMLAADPDFADSRAEFASWLLAQGWYDEASQIIGDYPTHRNNLVRGAIARAHGDTATAIALLRKTEEQGGENMQRLVFAWLRPAPTRTLTLGNDLDLGYLYGFAFGERAGETTYRWLQGDGVIRPPLPKPLAGNEMLALRLAAPALTPLTVTIGDQRMPIIVAPGGWRLYYLPLLAQMQGIREVTASLSAPTFLPCQSLPNNADACPLSVMVQQLSIR